MLTYFTTKTTLRNLMLRLHVDCDREEADLSITYGGRLLRTCEPVPFSDVRTPQAAERWMHRDVGFFGSYVETMEFLARQDAIPAGDRVYALAA